MNKGEIAWQIPNGDTPPAVKNNPALKGLTIPKTGSPSQAGLLVTKTLLFAGEGAEDRRSSMRMTRRLERRFGRPQKILVRRRACR